jgi:hypothetical protein
VNGTAGQKAIQVGNPSLFNVGSNILIHQTVGFGGVGTNAGVWETNQVLGIEGSTLLLAKPLINDFKSCGDTCGWAQVVVAGSYNQLEIVNGGNLYPSLDPKNYSTRHGGIVYIRARKIVVKTGGKIYADGYNPYRPGDNWTWAKGEVASSECKLFDNSWSTAANCSGGGGGVGTSECSAGGGGGGNKTPGSAGGGNGGQGGLAKGDANLGTLQFGGSGGSGYANSGGYGGGIIVLGAETIIVEQGASITANGQNGVCNNGGHAGGGGGAGGTVVLFANEVINNGTISANGGTGSQCSCNVKGGNGGDGWFITKAPAPGVVNESFAKGVQLFIDDQEVTPTVGDPNSKGSPSWDAAAKKWGADGLHAWSTGPLDLTGVASWTLGEHKLTFKETGGAGGDVKMFLYVIYPFTKSVAPTNDTCDAPVLLDLSGPKVISGTTEDVMGKIKATDANQGPFCGGSGGPDVVYGFTLTDWRLLTVDITSAFMPRLYIKKGNCLNGQLIACGTKSLKTDSLEPGTYYLFVDSDGNMQKGDFKLSITPAPPGPPTNDTCAGAQVITLQNGVGKASGMTLFSTDDYKAACGGDGIPENVYQFVVPPATSSLAIDVACNYNPVMYIARDVCTATPIACVPAASYTIGWPTPGTHYLFIDGKTPQDKGLYEVTVTVK